ncbi:EXPERA domain-containing protein [Plasmodiophora brassicae]|nr:hypothetical protein PBRA_001072 [Plasmodiophora brassicae]
MVIDTLTYYGVYFSPWTLTRPKWMIRISYFNMVVQAPFYAYACWVMLRGQREKPRTPFTVNAIVTLGCTLLELVLQLQAHPNVIIVMANLPWIIVPLLIIFRAITDPLINDVESQRLDKAHKIN